MDKGSLIWSQNMKRSMVTQKTNMSYPVQWNHWHLSVFLPLVLTKITICSKEEKKGKAETEHPPGKHVDTFDNCKWLRVSKHGGFSVSEPQKGVFLMSNFSCLKWRKILLGSKYLIYQNRTKTLIQANRKSHLKVSLLYELETQPKQVTGAQLTLILCSTQYS